MSCLISIATMGSNFIASPHACLPQPDRVLREAAVYYHLHATRAILGSLHFLCCRLFIVLLVLGDIMCCFFLSLSSSSPFMTLFRLLHGTTNAHQPRNLFPLPPFFTPRSARFRATRLVPYLIPSATAMEKQKEAQRAKPADNSETAPHGKGEQGTWVLWRCILTTAFLFLSLFFITHSLPNFFTHGLYLSVS